MESEGCILARRSDYPNLEFTFRLSGLIWFNRAKRSASVALALPFADRPERAVRIGPVENSPGRSAAAFRCRPQRAALIRQSPAF